MRPTWLTLPALATLTATGCFSSPEPTFYALHPEAGTALDSRPLRVELRRPGLPSYLDRPQLVRRISADQLELDARNHWGAPLTEMVASTVAENLGQRLTTSTVYTEGGAISSTPHILVELELQRFELAEDGTVQLSAQVAVHWSEPPGALRLNQHAFSVRPSDHRAGTLVAEMSRLLAQLSNAIARTILLGPPQQPARASAAARHSDSRALTNALIKPPR